MQEVERRLEEFGDLITFDTTYLTNKYDMSFAPFVGVNHHGQSMLFGCGLISSETAENFTWLFRSWLTCMFEEPPNAIITDQDQAMKKAIEIVFPNSRHRWCLWHIMKKVPEKLKGYEEYELIKNQLQIAVYDSVTVDEFEDNWSKLISENKLEGDVWLTELYKEKICWVPAFVRDSFWAGMSTTQWSEGINAFFDGYVNSKTSLKLFVEQYEHALRSKVEKENEEDFKSLSSFLPSVSPYEMEKQYQKEYTMSKFKEFQKELTAKMFCEFSASVICDSNIEYEICEDVPVGEKIKCNKYKAWFNESANEISCCCRLFEFRGILCRHAITTLIHMKVYRIPEKYILRRWSKNIKRYHSKIKIGYSDWSKRPEAQRFNKISNTFYEVVNLVTSSEDSSSEFIALLRDHKTKLTANSVGTSQSVSNKGKDPSLTEDRICDANNVVVPLSPLVVRRKGRPPSKRKQGAMEKICKKKKDHKKETKAQENNSVGTHDMVMPTNTMFCSQANDLYGESNTFIESGYMSTVRGGFSAMLNQFIIDDNGESHFQDDTTGYRVIGEPFRQDD